MFCSAGRPGREASSAAETSMLSSTRCTSRGRGGRVPTSTPFRWIVVRLGLWGAMLVMYRCTLALRCRNVKTTLKQLSRKARSLLAGGPGPGTTSGHSQHTWKPCRSRQMTVAARQCCGATSGTR